MVKFIENKQKYSKYEKNLQKKFKKFYLNKIKSHKLSNFHGKFLAIVSIEYLKKNKF